MREEPRVDLDELRNPDGWHPSKDGTFETIMAARPRIRPPGQRAIIRAVGDHRETIVPAIDDAVELVASARSVLRQPDCSIRRNGQTLRVAMSRGVYAGFAGMKIDEQHFSIGILPALYVGRCKMPDREQQLMVRKRCQPPAGVHARYMRHSAVPGFERQARLGFE